MKAIITVSQLNNYLKMLVDNNEALRNLTVKGEISNFTNHIKSGHFYFTLKDKNCAIRAVMFRTYAQRVRFDVQNGMNVLVTGSVRVFERDGAVQLYCEEMQPDGIGALYLAYEQLKERLSKQGLFDEAFKKPLPPFPQKIGVVTSKTGAALQDIRNILSRRYPIATLVLIPALVQGDDAPESICDAIALAQTRTDIDVLIVGRGGGSLEDLWAFNDERVAMAIFNCSIPVISAVGHEVDFTIADFVADLRAPTPSAAAELAVPDIRDLQAQVASMRTMLDLHLQTKLRHSLQSVQALAGKLRAHSPEQRVVTNQDALQKLTERLHMAAANLYKQKLAQYRKQTAMLDALSPLKVLTRGYSITYAGDAILTDTAAVQTGDLLRTKLSQGEIISRAEQILPSDYESANAKAVQYAQEDI